MGQKGHVLVLLLIILIFVISIIFIAGSLLIHNRLGLWPEKQASTLKRNYPEVIKGNWEPSSFHMTKMLDEDLDRIKALGVNTVSVS